MHRKSIQSAPPVPLTAQHRSLIWALAKREIAGRYRGATLGVFWSLLTPFLMLGVYTLALGHVLGSRWPGVETTGDFALLLFVGLIVHGFMAECLGRAPSLVVGNVNYVKRVVFPLELLPWPVVLSALFHLAVNFGVLLIALLATGHSISFSALLLPWVLLTFFPFVLGSVWLLAAFGVYFRDLSQLMGPVLTAMLFLSSAVVPVEALPDKYRWVFELNPLTPIINAARAVLLQVGELNVAGLWFGFAWGLAFAAIGYWVFRRLRPGFANVL